MATMFNARSIRNRFEFFEREVRFPDTPVVEDRVTILRLVANQLCRLQESIGLVECELRADSYRSVRRLACLDLPSARLFWADRDVVLVQRL